MSPWSRLAGWCVPSSAVQFGALDGYLPDAPDGFRWTRRPPLALVTWVDPGHAGQVLGGWELHRVARRRAPQRRHRV